MVGIALNRLQAVVRSLRARPGHEHVRGLVRELCVVGLDASDLAISFEVPVPDVRGRIDALFGSTIFEFKRDLRRELRDAEEGLARYLGDRERATGRRYLGIATDGAEFIAYELNDGELKSLDHLEPDESDPRRLLRWLDTAITVRADLLPDPETIRAEFGRDGLVYSRSMVRLRELWDQVTARPEADLKRELWRRHLEFVYGTLLEPEELFLQHTYLTIVAKTMAVKILASGPIPAGELLAGTPFVQSGLRGAVEADFFDWVLLAPEGPILVDQIAAQVGRFRLSEISVDILKTIYESLIDPRQRHYLGEYYTPDWLADRICTKAIDDPLNTRVLDPACGSGTFLFHAVRRFLAAAEAAGVPLQTALERCTDHVAGIDVHPVAVLFARVTYLLAIGTKRLRARSGNLSIPVFLGDSLQWDVRSFLTEEEVEVSVPGGAPLLFPGSVAGDPATLEMVLRRMRELADQNKNRRIFRSWLNARTILPEKDRKVLEDSYERMRTLHEEGRNHIWTYIVRNLTRPLWLSLRQGKPNVLIGNPPWLRYNAMSPDLQKRFRTASKQRGLWEGGRVATHQDLSAYFFARSIERYLPMGGRIAFVMPGATLSRRQFVGFRSGRFGDRRGNLAASVRFDEVWLFRSDVSPLFDVPSCVIFGQRTPVAGPLPETILAFEGQLPRRDATPDEADRSLRTREEAWPAIPSDGEGSLYARLFRQGATIVPRRLAVVVPAELGKFGGDPSAPLVESRVTSLDKKPWSRVEPLRGQIEEEFLRPLLLGSSIAPFRILNPALAVIPWDSKQNRLIDSEAALAEDYPHLAAWFREAERLWRENSSSGMTLQEQFNYYGKLVTQFPIPPIRVVYAASGTNPAACIVRDQRAVIEHKLYWMEVNLEEEAAYLTAILNSETVKSRVSRLQSEGQFGPRDFDKVIFTLPIPKFDPSISVHADLAVCASEATAISESVDLPPRGFQGQRKCVRSELQRSGVSLKIDRLVAELLSSR
jgi:hypothetical protein